MSVPLALTVDGASFGAALEEYFQDGVKGAGIRTKLGGATSTTFRPSPTDGAETIFPDHNNARLTNTALGDWNFYISSRTNPCGCRNRAGYIEFFNGNQAAVGVAFGSRLDNVDWTVRCKFRYVTSGTLVNGLLSVFDSSQSKGFFLGIDVSTRLNIYILGSNSPYSWAANDAVNILVPNTMYFMEMTHVASTKVCTVTAYSAVVDEAAWLAGGSSGTTFATCNVTHNIGTISTINKIGFGWVAGADGFLAHERQAVYFNGFNFQVFTAASDIADLAAVLPGAGALDFSTADLAMFLNGTRLTEAESASYFTFSYSLDSGGSWSAYKTFAELKAVGSVNLTLADGILVRVKFLGAVNEQRGILLGSLGGFTAAAAGTFPSEGQVLDDVIFGPNDTDYTGTIILPSENDVQEDVLFGALGTEFTGNFIVPTEAEVQEDIQYGALGTEFTGTYDPTGSAIYPAENDVENDVIFGPSGNDYTGNVTLPTIGDVQDGIQFGAEGTEFEGILALPIEAEVKKDTQFGASGTEFTGTYDPTASAVYPQEGEVENNIQFGPSGNDYTGNVTLPSEGEVLENIQYGASGSEYTGTWVKADKDYVLTGHDFGVAGSEVAAYEPDFPATSNVLDDDTVDGNPGLFANIEVSNVKIGEQWGANGTEFTGTFNPDFPDAGNVRDTDTVNEVAGTIDSDNILKSNITGSGAGNYNDDNLAVGNIRDGIAFGILDEGTLELPSESEVEADVQFGANGTEFTGTYDPMASAVFPSEDDVENGVVFGPTGAEYEGNVTLPSENNVRDDILFGASGIEFTGKIVIPDESDVRLSTMFDLSSMGVCRVPPVDKVEDGYMYDDNDSLEGTLSGGSGGNPVLGGHIIRRA